MLAHNPKTARQVDEVAVEQAYEVVRSDLAALDVVELHKMRILSLSGAIIANLVLVAVLFVGWLWWRGYV
ncbi:MAG: hypothetical protein P8P70_03205 [Sulfitobacter sp.]|nr:hypothetical protein [Sulfitobacter sp.]